MRKRTPIAFVFAALLLAACGSQPPAGPTDPADPESGNGQAQPQSGSVQIPDTPAGLKAQWVVDILQAEEDSTTAQWDAELDPTFLAEVSSQEVADLVNTSLRLARPFVVTSYQGTETEAVATLQGALGDPFNLTVTLGDTGKIVGLWFGPARDADWREPASLEEVAQRLQQLPADVSALVVRDGETLIDLGSEDAAPLASIFKLYVLLAVGQAVQDGSLTWEEELTLTDDLRSLPSGELQDEQPGTKITVRDAALKMISISDNTATDMLLHRVGREAVEAAVARSGHHDPSLMRPLPSTRELFTLGWGNPDYRQRWERGDESARRALLEEIADAPMSVEAKDVIGTPVWTFGIDWFASAADIAAAHRALQDLESQEIDAIVSENPGVDLGGWPYGAFKGGSSLGVLTGSWLLEDGDRDGVVVLLMRGDDSEAVAASAQELFGLAQAAIRLLREEGGA